MLKIFLNKIFKKKYKNFILYICIECEDCTRDILNKVILQVRHPLGNQNIRVFFIPPPLILSKLDKNNIIIKIGLKEALFCILQNVLYLRTGNKKIINNFDILSIFV